MTFEIPKIAFDTLKQIPHPLIFASLSGAHLYGFPSVDSDIDIRGAHMLPLRDVIGMTDPRDSFEWEGWVEGVEMDVVTYDLRKFCLLVSKKNGNVLEQLSSELTLKTTPLFEHLKTISISSVTKNHIHHYRGMAKNRRRAFGADRTIKSLLYTFRAGLTGCFLMETGEVEANLVNLNRHFGLSFLDEMIERKQKAEKGVLSETDAVMFDPHLDSLFVRIESAFEKSTLPEDSPKSRVALDDLLRNARLAE